MTRLQREDSRVTIAQGETLKRLTLLNMMYLPPTFAAVCVTLNPETMPQPALIKIDFVRHEHCRALVSEGFHRMGNRIHGHNDDFRVEVESAGEPEIGCISAGQFQNQPRLGLSSER